MKCKFQQWLLKILILFCTLGSNLSYAKPKVIAIIDTGLDLRDRRFSSHLCPTGHRDFTGNGIQDDNGHGTHVFGLIQKYAPQEGWCAVIVKYYGKNTRNGTSGLRKSFAYMLELRPDYVNYSGGGPMYDKQEFLMIKVMSRTKFVVAMGNEGKDVSKADDQYYPASYSWLLSNIIPVGSVDSMGTRSKSSNYGLPYIRTEHGEKVVSTVPYILSPESGLAQLSGTSMATAIATGKIVRDDLFKGVDRTPSSW